MRDELARTVFPYQAGQSRPALTTVSIPTAEMAEQGIELLIRLIERQESVPRVVRTADPVLVERASTAPPAAARWRGVVEG